MAKAARTDVHRKSQFVPEDYDYVGGYYIGSSDEAAEIAADMHYGEAFGVAELEDALEARGVEGRAWRADDNFRRRLGYGKCTACGAWFNYGFVYLHRATKDVVHLGHDCAHKYEGLKSLSKVDRDFKALQGKAAALRARRLHDRNEADFCASRPGLAEALQADHYIIADIRGKLRRLASISDKQVALVMKIANELKNPKPGDVHVPAPIAAGRQTVEGEVISLKSYEGDWGTTYKMTVKVRTPEGVWLAWGTCPNGYGLQRGDHVRFDARLKQGNEPHFATFSRPTMTEVLAVAIKNKDLHR